MSKYTTIWDISLFLLIGIGLVCFTGYVLGEQSSWIGIILIIPYFYFMPKEKEIVGIRVGDKNYDI